MPRRGHTTKPARPAHTCRRSGSFMIRWIISLCTYVGDKVQREEGRRKKERKKEKCSIRSIRKVDGSDRQRRASGPPREGGGRPMSHDAAGWLAGCKWGEATGASVGWPSGKERSRVEEKMKVGRRRRSPAESRPSPDPDPTVERRGGVRNGPPSPITLIPGMLKKSRTTPTTAP